MSTNFGETIFESSRALADDEDEDLTSRWSLQLNKTSIGESVLADSQLLAESVDFVGFVGKVAAGFGSSFLGDAGGDDQLLGEVFLVDQGENVVDTYQNRPKKKTVARLYRVSHPDDNTSPAIFAIFTTHAVPRYLSNDIVEAVSPFLDLCKRVFIFHSETIASYQNGEDGKKCKEVVYQLRSTAYAETEKSCGSCQLLPMPNVVGGVSGSLLMKGEMLDKPSLLLANYGETELVDSISTRPFFRVVSKEKNNVTFPKVFSQSSSKSDIKLVGYASPAQNSNLYV